MFRKLELFLTSNILYFVVVTIVPSASPTNVTVLETTQGHFNFSWRPPPCGDRNGHITNYVFVYGNTTTGSTNGTFVILDVLPNMTREFVVGAETLKGIGPFTNVAPTVLSFKINHPG